MNQSIGAVGKPGNVIVAGLVLNLDLRASASYARVPVVDGHASIPNAALHFHGGLGYLFGRSR